MENHECELLGLCFNVPVDAVFSFGEFRVRGEYNPHGWGFAYYDEDSLRIIKEPKKCTESPASLTVAQGKKSNIIVAHVRLASSGKKAIEYTHPFEEHINNTQYCFAHNGTLYNYTSLDVGAFKPPVRMDTRYAFAYIINKLSKRGIVEWGLEDYIWLNSILRELNKLGSLNCLLSDGEHLFCYNDLNDHNGGLSYVKREAPFPYTRTLSGLEVDLSDIKEPYESGYIIATRPLTNENWIKMHRGELLVFKDGKIIPELNILKTLTYSPHRLSIKNIYEETNLPYNETVSIIYYLKEFGYIRQDSRDNVSWDNEHATYYTHPNKRDKIRKLVGFSR